MFPTGLPSMERLKAKFHPKFAGLRTIKRPAGRAAAVPIETAQTKAKTTKTLLAKLCFDFMASIIRANWIFASADPSRLSRCFEIVLVLAMAARTGFKMLA